MEVASSRYSVQNKNQRVCVARYNSVVVGVMKLLKRWNATKFELSVPAIECNTITKRALPKIAVKTTGADVGSVGEGATTSRKVVSAADRSIRSCGVNAVVVSLSVISNDMNKRALANVAFTSLSVVSWSGEARRETSSASRAKS